LAEEHAVKTTAYPNDGGRDVNQNEKGVHS
jgi:hypothetical protein